MNYWPRWISAIKKRTATLSLAEMGAYDRLLDHYYAEEKPLPADLDECCRIAVALTKDERKAVEKVLAKFFVLTEHGHTNERADEEIQIALPKIEAAKANGAKGGRPKGLKKKPSGLPDGLPVDTQDEPTAKHPHPQKVGGIEPDGSTPPGPGDDAPPFGEYEPPAGAPLPGLEYARIAGQIRRAGLAALDPGYPAFRALVDAGATADEFIGFVGEALTKGQPFKWLIGAVAGERTRAAALSTQLHRGPMPNRQEAIEQRNAAVGDAWLAEQGAA